MEPCETCLTAGESCGTGSVFESKEPCVRTGCGIPTSVRSMCGAPRTFVCVPTDQIQNATGPRPDARVWVGQHRTALARSDAEVQPVLRARLAEEGLPPAQHDRAVELWNLHMRNIEYRGGHRTAIGILNGTFSHRQIPAVPVFEPGWLAPLERGPRWTATRWVIPRIIDQRPGKVLAGFDVNGMYLSAAACELGTGAPEHATWPAETVLALPGYVRVAALENAPWALQDRWKEGMWVPTPVARALLAVGAQFLIPESLTWATHRRWLDPHVNLFRDARTALMAESTPHADALLIILKDLYARMLGGLLRSQDKGRNLYGHNPAWADMVVATGQERMFRALHTADTAPVALVGVNVDAAWFVMPQGYDAPPGLTVSTQLGKWKAAGRCEWTPQLHAAHTRGEHETMRKALV